MDQEEEEINKKSEELRDGWTDFITFSLPLMVFALILFYFAETSPPAIILCLIMGFFFGLAGSLIHLNLSTPLTAFLRSKELAPLWLKISCIMLPILAIEAIWALLNIVTYAHLTTVQLWLIMLSVFTAFYAYKEGTKTLDYSDQAIATRGPILSLLGMALSAGVLLMFLISLFLDTERKKEALIFFAAISPIFFFRWSKEMPGLDLLTRLFWVFLCAVFIPADPMFKRYATTLYLFFGASQAALIVLLLRISKAKN